MDRFFIDSSALAKAFLQEAGTTSVLSLLEGTEDRARLFCSLTPLEVRSAVRRKQQVNDLTPDEAVGALATLADEMRRTEQMPLTQSLLHMADEVIDHFQLRAGDAVQLAAALRFAELHPADRLVFVACDDKLLKAAAAAGLIVNNPLTMEDLLLQR